jgi:hypothetical protein
MIPAAPKIKAHCNTCGGDRNHDVLHTEQTRWDNDEQGIYGSDQYATLKCCGCDGIKLRHMSHFSEDDEPKVYYFPPAIFRQIPEWFTWLSIELKREDEFVEELLNEIYVALQNNLPRLATMGVRALLEQIMISKVSDQGSFSKNLTKFEELGHVSKFQRERLATILDAGHAAIHRAYAPEVRDVVTLLDITEHIVESVFLHESKIEELKKKVPVRAKKQP